MLDLLDQHFENRIEAELWDAIMFSGNGLYDVPLLQDEEKPCLRRFFMTGSESVYRDSFLLTILLQHIVIPYTYMLFVPTIRNIHRIVSLMNHIRSVNVPLSIVLKSQFSSL